MCETKHMTALPNQALMPLQSELRKHNQHGRICSVASSEVSDELLKAAISVVILSSSDAEIAKSRGAVKTLFWAHKWSTS